jgi:hypothetical protein
VGAETKSKKRNYTVEVPEGTYVVKADRFAFEDGILVLYVGTNRVAAFKHWVGIAKGKAS